VLQLANYIKGLQPGGLQRYSHVAVESLPSQSTAAGIRPGACDTLATGVPAELAVHNTGHDLTGMSALWNYLSARLALCMPGAILLAGWPALPYGQLGQGPVHPSLGTYTNPVPGLVSIELFDRMIDELFNLCDQSLPQLRIGGDLRPMLHATVRVIGWLGLGS
jgi:hypothetical protein